MCLSVCVCLGVHLRVRGVVWCGVCVWSPMRGPPPPLGTSFVNICSILLGKQEFGKANYTS